MANATQTLDEADELVPDPQAQRELGITAMSMWRWGTPLSLSGGNRVRVVGSWRK